MVLRRVGSSRSAAAKPFDPRPDVLAIGADHGYVEHGDLDLVVIPADNIAVPMQGIDLGLQHPFTGRQVAAVGKLGDDLERPALTRAAHDNRYPTCRARIADGLRQLYISSGVPLCARSPKRPQNARPPLRASSVATILAMIPGARKVTGETSVPSRSFVSRPASRPSVTQGSGMGSQARSTCGIWIRWSISAMPLNPSDSAASAMSPNQAAGALAHGNREICKITLGRP